MLTLVEILRSTPYLMLAVNSANQETLTFVEESGTSHRLIVPESDPAGLFDCVMLGSEDVGFCTWSGSAYWWTPRTKSLRLLSNDRHTILLALSKDSRRPVRLEVRRDDRSERSTWRATVWGGRLNQYIEYKGWSTLADHVNTLWGKTKRVQTLSDGQAMDLYSPFTRLEWAPPWLSEPGLHVEGTRLLIADTKVYDFGLGARIQAVSGNSHLATASAIYFENPRLTERGGRNQWTDATKHSSRREVYTSVIVDLRTKKVIKIVEGAARLEVPRG